MRSVATGVVSEIVLRAPDPSLTGIISDDYQGWTEASVQLIRRREVPFGGYPLIINFGSPFTVVDSARLADPPQKLGSMAAGVHDSFVIIGSQGHSCCIQVNFTPIGARLFFQLPLSELANRSVRLEELFGDRSTRVVEALAEAGDWDRRFDLLEALIRKRTTEPRSSRPEMVWAWRQMQESHGLMDISFLARELRWSHKHLIGQFRDHLGVPPKRLGRILRFQRSVKSIESCNPARWAALAVDCGYFDQSHMIREFREFAGCTPKEYVHLRLPYGGIGVETAVNSSVPR
jgi:AraC-like DNA-binding protein